MRRTLILSVLALGLWSAPLVQQSRDAEASVLRDLIKAMSVAPDELLAEAFKAADNEQYFRAKSIAARTEDPALIALMAWLAATSPNTDVDTEQRLAFLDDYPAWPERRKVQSHLSPDPDASTHETLSFFETYPPKRNLQWLAYLQALDALGQKQKAQELAIERWISSIFFTEDEALFLLLFGDVLNQDHHLRRLDWLLDNQHSVSAKRLEPLLEKPLSALRQQRLNAALDRSVNRSALTATEALHADFSKSDIRRLIRNDQYSNAIGLFAKVDTSPNSRAALEKTRLDLAQLLIFAKRYKDALELLKGYRSDQKPNAEIELKIGWLELRQFKRAKSAVEALERASQAGRLATKSQAALWLAEAYKKLGEQEKASESYQLCAAQIHDLFAQICLQKLGTTVTGNFAASAESPELDKQPILMRAAKLLAERQRFSEASKLLYAQFRQTDQVEQARALVDFARSVEMPRTAINLADLFLAKGLDVWRLSRPNPDYEIQGFDDEFDKALFYALMFQESRFVPSTTSRAGALGVAQLLPDTAKDMARSHGLAFDQLRLIADPGYNAQLGWHYVSWLRKHSGKSNVLVLVGYNAGPSRARSWQRKIGPIGDDALEALDWIQHVPFSETRGYITKVLANVGPYLNITAGEAVPIDFDKVLTQ